MVKTKKYDRNIEWELARLTQIPAIITESIKFSETKDNNAEINFEFKTDSLLEDTSSLILDIEPIKLVYPSSYSVGQLAPRVLNTREDFPRDLPHINPGKSDKPANLCLARSGLQSIYSASGIYGVIEQLGRWLNDAKTETLYKDGWEPVPAAGVNSSVLGYIDAKYLQEYAVNEEEGGYRFLTAPISFYGECGIFIQDMNEIINTSDNNELISAKSRMKDFRKPGIPFRTTIPAVFVWPPINQISTAPNFTYWSDMQSLIKGLKSTNLYNFADEAFIKLDVLFGENQDLDMNKHRSILLIVGLWRPIPLDKTIVGLSNNEQARSLELKALYLERAHTDKDRWSINTEVKNFYGLIPATHNLLEAISGETALQKTSIIGAGALGSAMANYTIRGGAHHLTVFDLDFFQSHNIARHSGKATDSGLKKTNIIKKTSEECALDIVVKTINDDITLIDEVSLQKHLADHEIVIDTTADGLVRRRLSNQSSPQIPIFRAELYNQGNLGVGFFTFIGKNQNLSCLFYQLIAEAYNEKLIADWLKYESSQTFLDEELLLGFGCTSKTTKLPLYKVEQHASALFGFLKRKTINKNNQAAIVLNPISSDGTPLGFKVLEVDKIKTFFSKEFTSGWKVLITKSVLKKLHELREASSPLETGGYLYGGIDEQLSEIYIVASSDEPRNTKATETSLSLGGAGHTGFEQTFKRRTRDRLFPVGSWHSHPRGKPIASTTDWKTANIFQKKDKKLGFPTVMFITGLFGDQAYVLAD